MMDDMPRIRLVTPSEIRTPVELEHGVSHDASVDPPDDEQIIMALVAHDGIPARVAGLLSISVEYVLTVLGRNARRFSTLSRARMMLSSYELVMSLAGEIKEGMTEMPSDVLGRTYVGALTNFTNLAGQFEEQGTDEDTDDATAAKDDMLTRIEKMGKREAAARALADSEAVG